MDLGITGGDQVAEHEATNPATEESGVVQVLDLGFGRCKLQVQVPEKGDIREARDLVGKNVVTSFVGLTERYFAMMEGLGSGHVNGEDEGSMRTLVDGRKRICEVEFKDEYKIRGWQCRGCLCIGCCRWSGGSGW